MTNDMSTNRLNYFGHEKDLLLKCPVTDLDSLWELVRLSDASELISLLSEPSVAATAAVANAESVGGYGPKRKVDEAAVHENKGE